MINDDVKYPNNLENQIISLMSLFTKHQSSCSKLSLFLVDKLVANKSIVS